MPRGEPEFIRPLPDVVSSLHGCTPMQPVSLERTLCPALAAVALLLAAPVAAEPMDLSNATARWVAVRFEVSPEDRPGQVRSRFSRRFMAWLAPDEREGALRVTVAAPIVENHLFIGQEPSPGSFSDFVWIIDSATGHVLSARTAGLLLREIGWGFARWKTDATVDISMDTFAAVGFQRSRLLGRPYPKLCKPPDANRCTVVHPVRFEQETGYVNAVGYVTARWNGLTVRSFSPLGEAIFSEISDPFDTIWSQGEAAVHADAAVPAR